MKQSRNTAGVRQPALRYGIPLLSLALGAVMIFVVLAGQAQPVSAQYPVLPTATPASATATRAPAQYPVLPTSTPVPALLATSTPVPAPPTPTPVPALPTATVPAAGPTTPPVAQPTVAPAAPTQPPLPPTAVPVIAGSATATPAAVSAPMAATTTSGAAAAAAPGEGPIQSALRTMLTGLATVWLVLGVVVFVLAAIGIGYLFKNRGGES